MERGIDIGNVAFRKNLYGKPYLIEHPEVNFSISHCKGMVACGIYHKPLGIDVEEIRNFNWTVAKKVCSEEELQIIANSIRPEKEFFIYWTLKESLVKAVGVGLSYSLKNVTFIIKNSTIKCSVEGYVFGIYEIYSKFILAVCIPVDSI